MGVALLSKYREEFFFQIEAPSDPHPNPSPQGGGALHGSAHDENGFPVPIPSLRKLICIQMITASACVGHRSVMGQPLAFAE